MTINQCAPGCGLGRPGEGAAARFPRGTIYNIRWGGGGVIAFIFRPGGLNRTICPVTIAENMTIKRRTTGFVLKRLGDGVAASVLQGDVCRIFGWGVFRHSDFETRRTKAIKPPGPRQQRHENQTMDERVGAQVARGVCMGGRSDLPFLPCCRHG